MSVLLYLILTFLVGLVVGGLGRLAIPGPDPMSIWKTALIGIAGSVAAGLLWWIIFHRNGGGIVLSVLFATGIVYLIRRSRGGSLTDPGTPPG